MNDNHQRHLLVTFQYIDNLLSEAEHILAEANSVSPFQQYAADSTPTQRKVIHDYAVRVREAMARMLDELHIPRKPPRCGSLWAARGQISFASLAVDEIEPKRMRGYGEMSAEDVTGIGSAVAELNTLLDRLGAFMDEGPAADLQSRFQRLERTRDEARLLQELARMVTVHGMVEFRGTLSLLLERLERPTFEIGVFGRVSSGKSSLLNHLLGAEVLPVGVTPVTAIPTRIAFGPEPRVAIEFAETEAVVVEPARLAEFASEQQNPGNAKRVSRILVQLPSPLLKDGATLVDTPGLGSLATGGAEETLAYLPRCDLGLVLIDAASTLTHEDLKVVQALYRSGAAAMVLVSKADLLTPADRSRVAGYIREHVTTELHLDLPVHPVSVLGSNVTLCDDWSANELRPMLDAHRELAAASLKRKAGALREWVIRAMESRLGQHATSSPSVATERFTAAQQRLRESERLFEAARREAEEDVNRLEDSVESAVQAAASDLAAAWQRMKPGPVHSAQVVNAALLRVLGESSSTLIGLLGHLRTELEATLRQAGEVFPPGRDSRDDLPRPAGLPLFEPAILTEGLKLRRPRLLGVLGQRVMRHAVLHAVREQLAQPLRDTLRHYRSSLRSWLHQHFADLQSAYASRAEVYRALFDHPSAASPPRGSTQEFEDDLRRLREWTV